MRPIAVLDANVLFPRHLRGFLIHLAVTAKLFSPRWSPEILEEVSRNLLLKRKDMTKKRAFEILQGMKAAIPYASIRDPDLKAMKGIILPDLNDVHVLVTAIEAKRLEDYQDDVIIVTRNIKDFPGNILEPYGVVAKSPDEFILDLCENHLDGVLHAFNRHCSFVCPPMSIDKVFDTLVDSGLSTSLELIKTHTSNG